MELLPAHASYSLFFQKQPIPKYETFCLFSGTAVGTAPIYVAPALPPGFATFGFGPSLLF